jgi:hypothetical protein
MIAYKLHNKRVEIVNNNGSVSTIYFNENSGVAPNGITIATLTFC